MRATKIWALGFVLTTTVAFRETGNAQVPTGEPVAAQARSILQLRCFLCHGANEWGRVQDRGNVGSILDTNGLTRRQLITPGTPDQSVLLQKVERGEMPPRGERVPEAEVAVLRQWIAGMRAPATVTLTRRTPVTDADIERAIQSDLLAMPELDRPFVRYLSLHAVYNQCIGDPARTVELTRLRDAVTLLTNSLSWQRALHTPAELLDGALVRIDLRRLGWEPRVWGDLVRQYPYGHATTEAQSRFAAVMNLAPDAAIPWVRADWFVEAASRPPLYDLLLRLPDTDAALERQLMISAATNRDRYSVMRAGFVQSGVSQNNRVIERHESPFGAYWRSFDFEDNAGAHNVLARPLGPGAGAHEFAPSGGEIIFNLPNGLQAYMLVEGQGRRIAEAPTRIVHDTTNRGDPTVRNGISCIACHGMDGLKEKRDEVATAVERGGFPDFVRLRARAWYAPPERMNAALRDDADRYLTALRALLPGAEGTYGSSGLPVVTVARQHESPVTLTSAAAELGLTSAQLAARLRRSEGPLARVLGPLTTPSQTLPRDAFACAFRDMARELDPARSFVPAVSPLASVCANSPASAPSVLPPPRVTVTSLPGVSAPSGGCRFERTQVGTFPLSGQGTGPTQALACDQARRSMPTSATAFCAARGASASEPASPLTCQCVFRSELTRGVWSCSVRGTVGCVRTVQVCR